MSCEGTGNVSKIRTIGRNERGGVVTEITVNNHDYIHISRGYTHSGTCRKCKQERDSIVNVIINEIRNGKE